jgi:hypothetical protein
MVMDIIVAIAVVAGLVWDSLAERRCAARREAVALLAIADRTGR